MQLLKLNYSIVQKCKNWLATSNHWNRLELCILELKLKQKIINQYTGKRSSDNIYLLKLVKADNPQVVRLTD